MDIGNFKSRKRAGKAFAKSGQGEARLVCRRGDTNGTLYVLKTMPPAQASRLEQQERFKRGIEALRQSDDPHVLKMFASHINTVGATIATGSETEDS
jgi:hypothetical protein